MFAFLNNDHEASQMVYTPEQQMTISSLRREMAEIEAGLKERFPDWQDRMAQWEESVRNDQPEWQVCKVQHSGDNAQRYAEQPDLSQLAGGYAPAKKQACLSPRIICRGSGHFDWNY